MNERKQVAEIEGHPVWAETPFFDRNGNPVLMVATVPMDGLTPQAVVNLRNMLEANAGCAVLLVDNRIRIDAAYLEPKPKRVVANA